MFRFFCLIALTSTIVYGQIQTPSDQFVVSYFDNPDLEGEPVFYKFSETPEIYLPDGIGPDGLRDAFYSIRWEGNFSFAPGNYLVRISPDEGGRLIIDGNVITDVWDTNTSPRIYETNVVFGESQNIVVEFRDTGGFANLEFKMWNTSTWVQWPAPDEVSSGNCGLQTDPGIRSYHIGHSLVNDEMPYILENVSKSAGAATHSYGFQFILGAPLRYNWDNSSGPSVFGTDARVELTNGTYNTLILCEGGPIKSHWRWNDPVTYASNFYDVALAANPDTDLFIYATWPEYTDCMSPAIWNTILKDEMFYWEMIVKDLRAAYPDKSVNMIPVGLAMSKLHDAVLRGRVPGVFPSNFKSTFFADDIHMTRLGNYFVALVHYAAVYKRCPVDTVLTFPGFYGAPDWLVVDPAIAPRLQEIAWDAVREHELSGVE